MIYKSQTSNFKLQKVFRIIDVNTNRAVEGLRVMEEVARFILEDKQLTRELKMVRQSLRKVSSDLIKERRAASDVGRELYTRGEAKRETILDVFTANAKRVQEALRVLEEFSKLTRPAFGKSIKKIRFKIYDLEQKIYYALNRKIELDFDLYVITDPMRDHIEVAKGVAGGGGKILQMRDKTASKERILKWAKQIRKVTQKANVTFIVNDYVDIAKKVGADGVHLGQEDLKNLSIKDYKKRLGEDKIIGVSTHSFCQAVRAERGGADYISVGPIFKTLSKPQGRAVGLQLLRRVLKRVKIPVVAIGGINESNIYNVRKTGCQRIAVIRAVLERKDMKQTVRRLRNACLSAGF